jgi:predicted Zn-dependent protease
MKRLLLASALSLLALPAAAQRADIAPGYKPSVSSDEAGIWMIFEEAERITRQSPHLIKDPAINAYLQKMVCKLAGPQCDSMRVYLLDNAEFNATCAPNGMVNVYTGLLLRAENESQLAYVLGHEITHYLKRHSLNRYQSGRDTSNALAFLALGVAGASVGTGVNMSGTMDIASLVAAGALFSYNRDQERESDAGGLSLAVAAGYDPNHAAPVWKALEEELNADPRRRKPPAFFATHPANSERIQNLTRMAKEAGTAKVAAADSDEFEKVVGPYRAQWLEAELNQGTLASSVALLKRLSAARPSSGLYTYYLAEAYRRRNETGDMELALASYRAAAAQPDAPAAVHRGLGIAALRAGQKPEAKAAFMRYLEHAPSASDRSMVELYLTRTE